MNKDGTSVADFSPFVDISNEEADANAALICAAPTMKDVLQEVRDALATLPSDRAAALVRLIDDVLKQAEKP